MNIPEIQFTLPAVYELESGFHKGTIYNRVYFRIETSTYRPNAGIPSFRNDRDREEFYSLMRGFFLDLNFTQKSGLFSNTRVINGNYSEIHLHPDCLSGLVSDDELLLIHEKLLEFTASHPIFTHRMTEVTQRYEDICETEIFHRVATSKTQIIDALLKALKTSRSTTFKRPLAWTVVIESSDLKGFKFINSPIIFNSFNTALETVVTDLINQGWIKAFTDDNNEIKGYRTANKEESRQVKRDLKAKARTFIPSFIKK